MTRRSGIIATLCAVCGSFYQPRALGQSTGTGTLTLGARATATIRWNIEDPESEVALIVQIGKREVRLTGKEIMDALEGRL